MRLTPEQEERYARHLLLEQFGGEGQERLLALSVRVRGTGVAARWAARYLAASGVGRLAVDDPSWADELRVLGPWLQLGGETALRIAPEGGPEDGARAALDVMVGA